MAKSGTKSTNKPWADKSLTDKSQQKSITLIPQTHKGIPYLTFSFRYCTQQEYFGIAGQDAAWFANLQDRLKDLSAKTGAILENMNEREAYRLHPINWEARNCPIKKEDLTSVPEVILKNTEDDFFWQFQLSKGTGRVIGFFNEDFTIFYIVLLDPKHNIQPSKDYGYQVDETNIALTDYERIQLVLADAEKLRRQCKSLSNCPLKDLRNEYIRSDIFYACLDKELKDVYHDLMEDGSFQEKFEEFLFGKL